MASRLGHADQSSRARTGWKLELAFTPRASNAAAFPAPIGPAAGNTATTDTKAPPLVATVSFRRHRDRPMPVLGFPSALDTEDDFRGRHRRVVREQRPAVVISASSCRSAEDVPDEDTRRTMMTDGERLLASPEMLAAYLAQFLTEVNASGPPYRRLSRQGHLPVASSPESR
jgi:hypothetical protein